MRAACEVHERCAALHLREATLVEEAAGFVGQGQKVDDHVRLPQDGGQCCHAVVRFCVWRLRRIPAPSQHAVSGTTQQVGDRASHLAQPEHRHTQLIGAPLRVLLPHDLALLPRVGEEAAVQREHGPQRGLRHRIVHRRIDHARQRHVDGNRRVAQQLVDAGPERLNQAELRKPLQRTGRWVGNDGDVDAVDVQPRPIRGQDFVGQGRAQASQPNAAFGFVEFAREQDGHLKPPKP